MSAGRLRYLAAGQEGPAKPMFRLAFADGGELVLTEAGKKKRAGVWLLTPGRRSRPSSRTSAPTRSTLDAASLGAILRRGAAPAPPAPPRPARARRHRPRPRERDPLARRGCSPFRLSTELADEEVERLAAAIDDDLARALELRLEGKGDAAVYRVHGHFGEPCPRCGDTLRRVDFEEHTITYCPACQTGGRILKDRRLSRLLR